MCQTADEGIGQALGYFSTIMVKSIAVYIDHRLLKSITCGHHVGQARCEVGWLLRGIVIHKVALSDGLLIHAVLTRGQARCAEVNEVWSFRFAALAVEEWCSFSAFVRGMGFEKSREFFCSLERNTYLCSVLLTFNFLSIWKKQWKNVPAKR